MIATDYHVHTNFSTDGKATMEEMIKKAHDLGFSSLCFTDHMDYDFPEKYAIGNWKPPYFVFNPEQYWEKLNHLIQNNPYHVTIHRGVELGLKPSVASKNRELLKDYPWDFVIGSVHLVNDMDPYQEDYWNGIPEEKGILRFFEGMLECVSLDMDFDVLGHMDYVVRYAPSKNRLFTYKMFGDVLDEIMRRLINQGKGIEINTSGFKAGLGVPNPHPDIIKRYKELGGELLTIGSDAHLTEYLGYRFEEIRELLQSVGFRYYTVFQGRKAEFVPL